MGLDALVTAMTWHDDDLHTVRHDSDSPTTQNTIAYALAEHRAHNGSGHDSAMVGVVHSLRVFERIAAPRFANDELRESQSASPTGRIYSA